MSRRRNVLIGVSLTMPPDLAAEEAKGRRPRADYQELAAALEGDIMDHARARAVCGPGGRWVERLLGPDALVAWACFKQRRGYRHIVSMGESTGIPLALLLKLRSGGGRPRHLMVSH